MPITSKFANIYIGEIYQELLDFEERYHKGSEKYDVI